MKIIGINNEMFISSACIIDDGKIIAAVSEERLTRNKLTKSFPHESIKFCLKEAGCTIEDVDYIATSWNPGVYYSKYNPIFSGKRRHLVEQTFSVQDNLMSLYNRPNVDYLYQEACGEFGKSKVYHITHHRAHAANGFYLSPFRSAAILTADSQGEFESTTFSVGNGNKIEKIKSINYPQSIGMFYSTFTEFLGFKPNSDEWKVMALSSYKDHHNKYYEVLKRDVVKLLDDGGFEFNLSYFNGFINDQPNLYTEKFIKTFGKPKDKNRIGVDDSFYEIAAAMQKVTEEVLLHMLTWLFNETKEKNLVLSGGNFYEFCFQRNCKKRNLHLKISIYLHLLMIVGIVLVQHIIFIIIF
jgi:carbamoyltransferase